MNKNHYFEDENYELTDYCDFFRFDTPMIGLYGQRQSRKMATKYIKQKRKYVLTANILAVAQAVRPAGL